jgi:hypothetical protein
MALDKNQEIGVAALAAVTVGGLVYYLSKKAPGNSKVLQSTLSKDKSKIIVVESIQKIAPLDQAALDRAFASRINLVSRPIIPTFKEVSGFSNEPRMNNGLLGKLVAAYWAYSQTRLWYMSRCKQYHPFDDTPQWLAKDASHGGHDMDKAHYNELMKTDRGTWPIGVPRSFILNRFDGDSPSKFNKYQRYNSLDLTFPNWSMPFGGFDCVLLQAGLKHGNYRSGSIVGDCWLRCGWRRPRGTSQQKCDQTICPRPLPTRWFYNIDKSKRYNYTFDYLMKKDPFVIGQMFSGDAIASRIVATRGYKYHDSHWEDDKSFAGVVEKEHYNVGAPLIGGYPGRIWGKVSASERFAARYMIKVPTDFANKFSRANVASKKDNDSIGLKFEKELYRYYNRGYNLVNTCLDILIDRKHFDLEKEFPAFVKHCNWWWIFPPNKAMLATVKDKDGDNIRMPRLSDIGGGNMGLADVDSKYLVDYVMKLTPPPGTIPPWEDKGPLWLWPSTSGQMRLTGAPTMPFPLVATGISSGGVTLVNREDHDNIYLRSTKTDKWSSFNNFIQYALATFNEALYSYVVKEAGGVVEGYVSKTIATWAENIGVDVLGKLQDKLGSSFDGIMRLGTDIAAFAGMVENIDIANDLTKAIRNEFSGTNLNTYDLLKKYLLDTVDGVNPSDLRQTRQLLDVALEEMREWGWSDDLIGELGSVGSDYGNRGIQTLRSKYGYYK